MGEVLMLPTSLRADDGTHDVLAFLLDGVDPDQDISSDDASSANNTDVEVPESIPVLETEDSTDNLETQLAKLATDERFLSWIQSGMHNLERYDLSSEDIAQAALARMIGRTIQLQKVRSYAYSVANSIIVSLSRHAATVLNRSGHREDYIEDTEIIDYGSQEAMARVEGRLSISPAVRSAIQALPWRQRQAVMYRYYIGLDVEAAAEAMKVAQGTVKASCARGLKNLRESLEGIDIVI